MAEQRTWNGVVIAESLRDPTVINGLPVYRAHISAAELPIDGHGSRGRWHQYWVRASSGDIRRVQSLLVTDGAWYAHFWRDDRLLVVFDDEQFEVDGTDDTTWQPAIDHGVGKGIPLEQLDFPTDDSAGMLE